MLQGAIAKLTHSSPISITLSKASPRTRVGLVLIELLISIYGGYYGGGVGILLLLCYFGFLNFANIHEMNTLKVLLAFAMNAVAGIYFAFFGLIDWPTVLILGTGSFIGGWMGSRMAHRLSLTLVRGFIVVTGLVCSGQLFYQLWK